MRKILLGTTAVAGAALMGLNVAHAQAPAPATTLDRYLAGEPRGTPSPVTGVPGSAAAPGTFGVRIGGYFEFAGGYIRDSADRNVLQGTPVTGATPGTFAAGPGTFRQSRSRYDFKTDTEIVVIVNGKAANGLAYGAQVELQIDNILVNAASAAAGLSGGTGAGTSVDTDEAWGYIASPTLGTLMFGDQDSAASQMTVSLPGAVQQLGMSTQWDEFIAITAENTRYLVADINDGNDSSKVIYLSPQFFGFDFGVSFAPNRREGEEFRSGFSGVGPETQRLQRDRDDIFPRNELSWALRYRGTVGNIGVAASFVGHRMDAPAVPSTAVQLRDVSEYQAGLNLSGFGVTVGGMYRWGAAAGVTGFPLRQGLKNGNTWGVGATYVTGPIAVGAFFKNIDNPIDYIAACGASARLTCSPRVWSCSRTTPTCATATSPTAFRTRRTSASRRARTALATRSRWSMACRASA